jgi:DNA-binding MarR family transcriptional regulator
MTATNPDKRGLELQADKVLFTSSLDGQPDAPSRAEFSDEQQSLLDDYSTQIGTDLVTFLRAATPFLRAATQTEWNVLSFIANFDASEGTPAHIAQEITVTKARVTQICNSLEERGLIERHPDESDHRKVCFTLTDAGQKLCSERDRRFLLLIQNYLLLLGQDDAREFMRLLDRTARIVSQFDMTKANEFLNQA